MQRARASASSAVVDDYVAYLGGAVWTMDWLARAKTADAREGEGGGWLAAAARGAGHHAHAVRDVGACRGTGMVQVWRVETGGGANGAVMVKGLTHAGGCASDVKWSPTMEFLGDRATDDAVGALAVSAGDGEVKVCVVEATKGGEIGVVEDAKAEFVGVAPKEYGAPWRLDWNAVVPGRLAAGCTSGRVDRLGYRREIARWRADVSEVCRSGGGAGGTVSSRAMAAARVRRRRVRVREHHRVWERLRGEAAVI